MSKLQRERELRTKLYSPLSVAIVLIITIVLARAVWSLYKKDRATSETVRQIEKQVALLEARKKELETATARLESVRGHEEQLRATFPVARPGEQVVVILDEATTSAASTTRRR